MPGHPISYRDVLLDLFPGPYMDLRVSWHGNTRSMLGLLDSGADQSIVPDQVARALGLTQIDEVDVEDANGGSERRAVYAADLEFDGHSVTALPMAGTDYPIVLLGRDVLNGFRAVLDGPAQEFTLSKP